MLSGRVFSVCFSLTVVVIALVVPGAAVAQTSSDPTAGSPPAAVYQIPLEGGRRDAAPRNGDSDAGPAGAGGSGGGSGGSTVGSTYRSDNNFGSSSQVPGAAHASAGGTAPNDGSGNPGSDEGAGRIPTGVQTVDDGDTSVAETVGLLALIAAAGIGIVALAVRAARRAS